MTSPLTAANFDLSLVDKSSPVLVTGATGYLAGVLCQRLLEAGFTVHAAVREPGNPKKTQFLDAVAANAPGTLVWYKADLLTDGAYADAMAGCAVVLHTASPFALTVADPQRDLVEPAQAGTRNVLTQASATPSVRRIVVTSSAAAIYGDNADLAHVPGHIVTEEQWNSTSSLHHQPYSYSKTLAERVAWELASQQHQWDLVTINPSFVIGPSLDPHAHSESLSIFRQYGDGSLKTGVPDWELGVVDVRDVAEAHLRAAFLPEAQGRYITSGHDASFQKIAEILRPNFGATFPIPARVLPKWLIWMVGPMMNEGMTRKSIALNLGHPFRADNSKSVRELGMRYRPLEASVVDFFQFLVDNDAFRRVKAKA